MRFAISIAAICVPLLLAATLVLLWIASPEYEVEFLLVLLVAGAGSVALGPLFTALRTWKPQRSVFWASLVAFLLTVCGGALLSTSRAAFARNFGAVRGDFEQIRDQVLAGAAPQAPVKIGRFRVQSVRRVDEAVFFILWRSPDTETGIVWSHLDRPPVIGPRVVRANARKLAESWYTFYQSND